MPPWYPWCFKIVVFVATEQQLLLLYSTCAAVVAADDDDDDDDDVVVVLVVVVVVDVVVVVVAAVVVQQCCNLLLFAVVVGVTRCTRYNVSPTLNHRRKVITTVMATGRWTFVRLICFEMIVKIRLNFNLSYRCSQCRKIEVETSSL